MAEVPLWISAFASCIAALATAFIAKTAYSQLSTANSQLVNLSDSLRLNSLGIVLQLEADMNTRKQRIDEQISILDQEFHQDNPDMRVIDVLERELDGYVENWLNAADRLAFCILKGYLEERDWASEYRRYFADLIRNHREQFGPDTIYTNIKDLHDRWARS